MGFLTFDCVACKKTHYTSKKFHRAPPPSEQTFIYAGCCRSDHYVDEQCGRDYLTTRGYPMLEGMSSKMIVQQLMCLRAIVNKKGRNDAMHMAVMLSLDRNVAMHAFRTFF